MSHVSSIRHKDGSSIRRMGANARQRVQKQKETRRQVGVKASNWFTRQGWRWFVLVAVVVTGSWLTWSWLRQWNPMQLITVQHVEIEGNRIVTWEDVLLTSGIRVGEELFSIDRQKIEARIASIPVVEKVEVHRKLPSTIKIIVVEAEPLCLVGTAGAWKVLGTNGQKLPIDADPSLQLPIVEAGKRIGSLTRFLATMRRYDPALYGMVSQAVAKDAQSIEVIFRDAPRKVIFPQKEEYHEAAFRNYRLLAYGMPLALEAAITIDMRFPGYAYAIDGTKG